MSHLDDICADEDHPNPQSCTGVPATCPCDSCAAFQMDMEADEDWEPEDQDAA